MTKFWIRFCIKLAQKEQIHFLFSIHFQVHLPIVISLSQKLWEDLTLGFSKTWVYLISQIEESWRLRMSWVLRVEFWRWSYQNRRLHTDLVLHWFCARSDSIGKKLVIIQDVLNLILSSPCKPLFLSGMGHFVSSLLYQF